MALLGGSEWLRQPGIMTAQLRSKAHAAATATETILTWIAPQDCRLMGVHFYPDSAVTGADTNTTHLNVLDGATEIDNYDLTSGNDIAVTGYTFSTTLARDLSEGDRVIVQAEKVGTGLDVPAGTFVFEYDFQYAD